LGVGQHNSELPSICTEGGGLVVDLDFTDMGSFVSHPSIWNTLKTSYVQEQIN